MEDSIERVNLLRALQLVSWWQQPIIRDLMEYKQQPVTDTGKADSTKEVCVEAPQERGGMSAFSM